MLAKINGAGAVQKYPYSIHELRLENPNTSFSSDIESSSDTLAAFGVVQVSSVIKPTFDEQVEKLVEVHPVNNSERWEQRWEVVALTENEIAQAREAKATQIRTKRNRMLMQSDWTQVADAPVNKQAWADYRQALRDVTAQSGFPLNIEWPTLPE